MRVQITRETSESSNNESMMSSHTGKYDKSSTKIYLYVSPHLGLILGSLTLLGSEHEVGLRPSVTPIYNTCSPISPI